MKPNILVIGGNGFLGRHLIAKLLNANVRVFCRRECADLLSRGVEIINGDLRDYSALLTATKNIDVVFHTAAKVGVSGRYHDYYQTNVIGTKNVINACRENGVQKLIYTSTPSVVFGVDDIDGGDETLPYPQQFLTAYAETKALAEQAVLATNDEIFFTCALRPHIIWGVGDTNLIPRLIAKARAKKLLQIGDGKNLISVSYVENVADAHLAAMNALQKNSRANGNAYFINETEPVNCWAFIAQILAAFKLSAPTRNISLKTAYAIGAGFEFMARFFPNWEPPMTRFLALQLAKNHWFKNDKAQRDLNWQPKISINEGLKKLQTLHENAAQM